jgi:hypothetical protein
MQKRSRFAAAAAIAFTVFRARPNATVPTGLGRVVGLRVQKRASKRDQT